MSIYCAKYRWLCSSFCTFLLLLAIFALPLWNLQIAGRIKKTSVDENAVSVVTVMKKKQPAAPVQKIQKKLAVPKQNVIPKKQKPEKKVEKQIVESEKIQDDKLNPSDGQSDIAEKNENTEITENAPLSEFIESENQFDEKMAKAAESYKTYALARIASKKMYPYSARSKGLEGKVRVRVIINPDGNVAETEILEKCEHEILNEACLAAVKKAAPFKKMKKGQNAMTLTFAMDFSLKEKKR